MNSVEISPRRSGKTKDCINQFMEDSNNTTLIVPNQIMVNIINEYLQKRCRVVGNIIYLNYCQSNIMTVQQFINKHNSRLIFSSDKKIIIDEYFMISASDRKKLYEIISSTNEVTIRTTSNMLYDRKLIDLTNCIKTSKYPELLLKYIIKIRQLNRVRGSMLDLSPENAMSLMVANDFDSKLFVEKDLNMGIEIRNLEIKLEIATSRYSLLFGEV